MNEHCRVLGCAVVEKGDDRFVVQIRRPDVVSDLHADVTGAHAARQFVARKVRILERNLA